MRKAEVLFKDQLAGLLVQDDEGSFLFTYQPEWAEDSSKPAISLTLPKRNEPYRSEFLFPFFYNMLPEGSNMQVVCRMNRLDKYDYFGLLLTIAKTDTIGAVTVHKIESE